MVLRTAVNCTITVDQILTVQKPIASKDSFGVPASPVIDGYVLNDMMENNYARGDFQKVPILVGTTANETSIATCPLSNNSATIEQVQKIFQSIYNSTTIKNVFDIYRPISISNNPLAYLNAVYSDSWAHCEARRFTARFSAYEIPSY